MEAYLFLVMCQGRVCFGIHSLPLAPHSSPRSRPAQRLPSSWPGVRRQEAPGWVHGALAISATLQVPQVEGGTPTHELAPHLFPSSASVSRRVYMLSVCGFIKRKRSASMGVNPGTQCQRPHGPFSVRVSLQACTLGF